MCVAVFFFGLADDNDNFIIRYNERKTWRKHHHFCRASEKSFWWNIWSCKVYRSNKSRINCLLRLPKRHHFFCSCCLDAIVCVCARARVYILLFFLPISFLFKHLLFLILLHRPFLLLALWIAQSSPHKTYTFLCDHVHNMHTNICMRTVNNWQQRHWSSCILNAYVIAKFWLFAHKKCDAQQPYTVIKYALCFILNHFKRDFLFLHCPPPPPLSAVAAAAVAHYYTM